MKNNEKSNLTRVITVASGKGGVGKTNISINLAIAMAKLKEKILLMDADIGMANVNILLGITPQYSLYDVLKGTQSIASVIVKTDYGIQFLPGLSALYEFIDLKDKKIDFFFQQINQLENLDTVFVDLGAGISKNILKFILYSDQVLMIITPEPTSITDSYSLIKYIGQSNKNFKIQFILNKISTPEEADRVANRLIRVSKTFLKLELEYLGFIFNDSNVKRCVMKQIPFYIETPNSKASKCIKNIASNLLRIKLKNERESINLVKNSFFDFFNQFIKN